MKKFSDLFEEEGGGEAAPSVSADTPVSNNTGDMATTGYGLKQKPKGQIAKRLRLEQE